MTVWKLACFISGFAMSGVALAQESGAQMPDVQALLESKECMSCHALDMDMSKAPSFQKIARKYHGMTNIEVMLTQKVEAGGVGHWGPSPMPGAGARPAVSSEEARVLVDWVLQQ